MAPKLKYFGTSGIRKVFHTHGKGFTPALALRLGLALGTHVKGGTVVVGRDIRTTALPVELALCSGLVSTGCRVLTIGMVTTPTLAYSTKFLNGNAGVIITASHNPPDYIGVKFWNNSGLGFKPDQERAIERILETNAFAKTSWSEVGSVVPISDINYTHVERIAEKILNHGNEPNEEPLNVILDPGNGASCEIAPLLLKELNVKFITLNSQPDGHFPGRLSEPSAKNLKVISDIMRASRDFQVGMALDGDADRIVFLDELGNRIEPIHLLALLAREMLKKTKNKDVKPILVTPVDSTSMIEKVVEPLGGRVVRCEVGDIKVAIKIQELNGMLGGETAGTYIWPTFHYGPDSLVTMAETVQLIRRERKPLSELLADLPYFPYIKHEVPLARERQMDRTLQQCLKERVLDDLQGMDEENIRVLETDGIRFDFEDGWILFRESGTTPIMRLMAESYRNKVHVESLVKYGETVVRDLFETKSE